MSVAGMNGGGWHRICCGLMCLILSSGVFSASALEDEEVYISPKVEAAIMRGLSYLARTQNADGSWSGQYGKNVGVVSLCVMAFMSMGNLPGEGPYGRVVAKGVDWIIKQAQPTGLIKNEEGGHQGPPMYGHALSTLMLSEVWGQTRRDDVGRVLRKAVQLILQVQGKEGGWNYKPVPQDGDTSVCVMQLFALKSAYEAGIYVPDGVIQKALNLIRRRYDFKKKMFGYRSNSANPGFRGSSAAGVCIMHICGERTPKFTREPLLELQKLLRSQGQKGHFYYFVYYGSVASYYAGGEIYRNWQHLMEPLVLRAQKGDGSWQTKYKTAFAILALALPYRYIPIYQHR